MSSRSATFLVRRAADGEADVASGVAARSAARTASRRAIAIASTPAVRAAGAKCVALPLSAILALAASRIVIQEYGLAAYGLFALILSIPAVLPSRDLGLGAKVIDVVARRSVLGPDSVATVLSSAVGKVARFAGVLLLAVVGLQLVVGWHRVLGSAVQGLPEAAISAALICFVVGLPGGLAGSVLWGLRRTDLLALQAPILTLGTLLGVVAASLSHWPVWVAIVFAMAMNSAIQWATLAVVTDRIGLSPRSVLRRSVSSADESFRAWAVPMFVISAAAAIGYQADRIILSHTADAVEVARYSVAAQLFFPLWGIVSSAGYTLWGKYALEREDEGVSSSRFRRTVAAFAGAGLVGAGLLIAVGPWAIRVLLEVNAPRGVYIAFGLLLALQATGLPIGMLLTDRNGLRWQAVLFSIMVLVNVWLSISWSSKIGAAGPVLASAVAYGCAVLAPSIVLARRYVSGVHAAASA